MRHIATALVALLLAAGATTAMAQDLTGLRWEKRVLALFDTEGSEAIERQAAALMAERDALAERDMVVFAVIGEDVRPIYGTPPADGAERLRQRLGAASDGFEAVLIGKDGGVKHRSRSPLALQDLEAIVDAMPMRRAGG